MSTDFAPGNVRVRVRRTQLLSSADYDRLSGLELDALIEALGRTAYAPHLEAARAAGGSQARWQLGRAVARRQRDALRPVPAYYSGTARDVVSVLLARHDLADVLAMVRGALGGHDAETVADTLMLVGRVGDSDARDILAAPEPAVAISRLIARRLPDPGTARQLDHAWQRFTLHHDPAELELEIAGTAIEGWLQVLRRAGRAARPVLDVVLDELDRSNVLTRLRATGPGAAPGLPEGTVPALTGSSTGSGSGAVSLDTLTLPVGWRPVVERAGTTTADELDWALSDRARAAARRGWIGGDPLGAGVPVAYVLGVEAEARNVRLLALAGRDDAVRTALVG